MLPYSLRKAILESAGFTRTIQPCPVCEERLYQASEIAIEHALFFDCKIEVYTEHKACPKCGYEHISTTSKPL